MKKTELKNLVTRRQALLLKELGYDEICANYMCRVSKEDDFDIIVRELKCDNFNSQWFTLSLPTVDEAIDWLRRTFRIVVADKTIPYVCPDKHKIMYGYTIKWCNLRDGWNGRVIIGNSIWSYDCYAAKRDAISRALRWLNKRGSTATGQ